jgi:CheY-like chemotaxis protein/anti-sigma regulatory factor (Ser/Thr protein kinase)
MYSEVPFFEIAVIDPDLKSLRELRNGLRAALAETEIPNRLVQDLLLSVQEHATNLVRHGKPSPTRIAIKMRAAGGAWSLSIEDDAGAFRSFDAYMALATLADRRTDPRTHGMGLKFIGTRFADHVYEPGFGKKRPNSLTLHFPPRAEQITRPLIVLIEDDDPVRFLIKGLLRQQFRVFDFALPSQALRVVRSHQPDLILCDIGLPEMDGMTFRRELAKDIDTDIVPFVFLSAHNDDQTIDQANDLGIDDYVEKPPRPAHLLGLARRLITRSRRVREALIAKLAKDLTAGLKTEVPKSFGPFELGVASESASLGGGDLVQVGHVNDRLVVLLADVMGHGLAARFYAHGVAAYFRAIVSAAEPDQTVDEMMTQLSNAVLADPGYERTILSAQIFDLHPNGTVCICSAGHPFPVMTVNGEARWLEISGPLLALVPDLPFPTQSITLEPGSRIALYTDGLSEIPDLRRDPVAAGRRLFSLLEAQGSVSVAKMPKAVLDAHKSEVGPLMDDTSLLVVERKP